MKRILAATSALAFVLSAALPAIADRAEDAVMARQGLMNLNSFNLGGLAAMAKGEVPYDAAQATVFATNLNQLSHLEILVLFPIDTDNEAMPGKTRALKALWADPAAVEEKIAAWRQATETLAAEAGGGLDSVKAGLGALGKTCNGCHESFRQPN
ncbi:cytochrome c [Stappia sp. F7233]|uniref:Cytochrome c n=1 Tax=Stappia albiluteola TaxID=2758565 RepID=A0A839AFC0_9HYPH|nr:cytochrome c [Stappia albiluteola]MBA5777796.1 cytochrome c [Stappia albiluteola]